VKLQVRLGEAVGISDVHSRAHLPDQVRQRREVPLGELLKGSAEREPLDHDPDGDVDLILGNVRHDRAPVPGDRSPLVIAERRARAHLVTARPARQACQRRTGQLDSLTSITRQT
jgi:hypothetical protein